MTKRFFKKRVENMAVTEIVFDIENDEGDIVSRAVSETIRLGKKNYLIKNENNNQVKVYIW